MSLSTSTLERLPKIQKGLITGLNREEIGKQCNVTEKTIDRDITRWVDSGLFEVWLKEEWMRHHIKVSKKHPIEAYRQLTKLLGQTLTHRMELKEEIKEIKLVWIRDEPNPTNKIPTT